ncbi:MAG: HIT family protein [bacterium]|nr:HIT family protein [bacterium]
MKELETGFVVLGDYQFFKGYTLFLCRKHVFELHDLEAEFRKKFLYEMSLVTGAVFKAFQPNKLNYELLGNTEPHVHWHIFPRYHDDPAPHEPVWVIEKEIRYDEKTKPANAELKAYKEQLLRHLP